MLKQKFLLSYTSKIGIQLIQLISNIVVARIAGPTIIGTIAFGLSFVNMFSFIGNLGMASAHIKLMNEGYETGSCITVYSIIHVSTKFLFLLVVIAYYLIQKFAFNYSFESEVHEKVIFIFLLMSIIQTFIDIPLSTFIAKTEQAKQDISELIKQGILQPSRIVAVLLGGQALALSLVNFSAVLIVIPVYWYFHKTYSFGKFNKTLLKKYMNYAIPLISIGIASSLIHTLDKVLLQYFWNSEEVGYYSAAYRISSIFLTMSFAVANLFFPLFAKSFNEKKYGYIQDKIDKFEHLMFVFMMPIMIFIMVYSDTIVHLLLGEKFLPSVNTLSVLTCAMFIYMISIPYGNLITGIGLFKLTAIINIINLIIMCSFMVIFVHPSFMNMKSTGTAYAMLVSYFYLFLVFRFVIQKYAPQIKVHWNIRYLLYGIINFTFFYYLYNFLSTRQPLITAIVFPLVYITVTFSTLYFLKLLTKQDLQFMFSLFKVKNLFQYINNEIRQ